MLARKKRKKPNPWLIEPEYDNPHVVNITTKRTEPPPRNRFDLTNDNLSALFTVKSASPPRQPLASDNDEPTSFAAEMMEHLSGMKIKKKLDFDNDTSEPGTVSSLPDERATCCTLRSFVSEESISRGEIAPMVMTPSSKWNCCSKPEQSSSAHSASLVDNASRNRSGSSDPVSSNDSVSLASLDPKLLGPENDEDSSTLGLSDKSDDDMMNRGKPAVVLGYQTDNATGERKPCVMLGMIANRDLDGFDDLLDPDNKPNRKGNEGAAIRGKSVLNKSGIKSVRFDLNVQYIENKTSYDNLYEQYDTVPGGAPGPRAGVFRKTHQKVRDSPVKRLRTPVPESDGPTYDELSDGAGSKKNEEKTTIKKRKVKNEPKQKREDKADTTESSIDMIIPKHNNIGDIKRFHNRSRFQHGIDHQPEKRMISTKDENHYYYDPNHEMSEYYYYYVSGQDAANDQSKRNESEKSMSLNRKKRRLQKLKKMRADKEHTERIHLQKRYDALEDQVTLATRNGDQNDNDSDLAVGEGTFKGDKKLHFGRRQLDGFHLAKQDVDGFYGEQEEFTEDLSSESSGLSPPLVDRKRPPPLLNIGATDKKFKDFGPALEFEANNVRMAEMNERDELLEPGEIVQELMVFNHAHDSLSEYNQQLDGSIDESSILRVNEDEPANVEIGFRNKKKRGKPINVKAFNEPIDIIKQHNEHDELVQRELTKTIVDRKHALMTVVGKNVNNETVVNGLEVAVKVGETKVIDPFQPDEKRDKDSDDEYEDSYAEPPGQTQIGTRGMTNQFLLEKKPATKKKLELMTTSEKQKKDADPHGAMKKPLIATSKPAKMRAGMENRTVEQDFMVKEVKAAKSEHDCDDTLLSMTEMAKLGVFAGKLKKIANRKKNEFKRRQTGFGRMPGADSRFDSAKSDDPYYSEPATYNTLDGANDDTTYSLHESTSLAKDIAVAITKKTTAGKTAKADSQASMASSNSGPLESIASDLIKSDLASSIEYNENGTIKVNRDKIVREEIMHRTFKDVLDEIIIAVAIESVIDVEAGKIIKDLDERAKIQKQQNILANNWKRTAEPELQRLKSKKAIEPAKGPVEDEEIDKENDINLALWNDVSPRKKTSAQQQRRRQQRGNQREPAMGLVEDEEIDKENDINLTLWNDVSPRKKASAQQQRHREPLIERADQSLRRDLQMSLDGAYLPTPRSGSGTIWASTKLPARQLLLREMMDDAKYLMDWIKSGVPAVFVTSQLTESVDKVSNELSLINASVVELLDHNDPASGELLQSCKCLRHELNRSDEDIKSIEFITNCLLITLQCFDNTETFIEPAKFVRLRHLITTLSYELKTQGLEASQQLVANTGPSMPLPSAFTIPNPEVKAVTMFDNVDNWSMSEPITATKSDDDQSIISNTTSCTLTASYVELNKSDDDEVNVINSLHKVVNCSNKMSLVMSDYVDIFITATSPMLHTACEWLKKGLTTNIGEKVFLGALLVSVLAVLWALMTGMSDAIWSPATPSQLY